jgi:hypothetical protein
MAIFFMRLRRLLLLIGSSLFLILPRGRMASNMRLVPRIAVFVRVFVHQKEPHLTRLARQE